MSKPPYYSNPSYYSGLESKFISDVSILSVYPSLDAHYFQVTLLLQNFEICRYIK